MKGKEMRKKTQLGLYVDQDLVNRIDYIAETQQSSRNHLISEMMHFVVDLYEERVDIERRMDNAFDEMLEENMQKEIFGNPAY